MSIATVVGADGFIGSQLVRSLKRDGHEVAAIGRHSVVPDRELGTVYYCAGVTADFRSRPRDTVTAHVCVLAEVAFEHDYDTLVYCSSTRVYSGSPSGREDIRLATAPGDPSDLYNLSKLMGEAVCLSAPSGQGRIARLANVVGPDLASRNFVADLVGAALANGEVRLRQRAEAARDYIALDDVLRLLPLVASGRERIYNVASGHAITNRQIGEAVAHLTGRPLIVEDSEAALAFPSIDISRIREEFGFEPADVLGLLPQVVAAFGSAAH